MGLSLKLRRLQPSLTVNTYFLEFEYHFAFPPVLVSSHLGLLKSRGNPTQLLVALLEFGPVIIGIVFYAFLR